MSGHFTEVAVFLFLTHRIQMTIVAFQAEVSPVIVSHSREPFVVRGDDKGGRVPDLILIHELMLDLLILFGDQILQRPFGVLIPAPEGFIEI